MPEDNPSTPQKIGIHSKTYRRPNALLTSVLASMLRASVHFGQWLPGPVPESCAPRPRRPAIAGRRLWADSHSLFKRGRPVQSLASSGHPALPRTRACPAADALPARGPGRWYPGDPAPQSPKQRRLAMVEQRRAIGGRRKAQTWRQRGRRDRS